MDTPKQSVVDAAIDALNTVRRRWHRVPGVTATDVGFKFEGDRLTDIVALRVHVKRKRPVPELAPSEVFNEATDQRTVDGFPVDVIEAEYQPGVQSPMALEDVAAEDVNRRVRIRPIIGGISVGNPRITAGTLGTMVFGRRSCQAFILSNFHILAGELTAMTGEAILQPGPLDGGRHPADRVATLNRFRIDAQMDAAVARIDSGIDYDREILGLGTISGTTAPALGMQVTKSGRTTGITASIIDGVSAAVTIDYEGTVGVLTLTDQVHLVPRPPWPRVDREVSQSGDSGSIWLEDGTRRAVGLHFAGDNSSLPAAEFGICTPIDRVMSEFDISFLPVLCPMSDPTILPRNICERFPRLCELILRQRSRLRPPREPFPVIPVPPVPPPRPGPDPAPFFRGPSSQGAGRCGCSSGLDEQVVAELAELLLGGDDDFFAR